MPKESAQVVVVGGGITGLACAHRLGALGCDVILVEAGDRAGGVIRTVARDGFEFEAGPNTLLATSDALWDLIGELGLEDRVIDTSPAAKRRYVLYHGRLVPVPSNPLAAITSPLLGPAGLARALGDLFGGRAAGVPGDESVASFVRRRFGRRVLENLVAPFLAGVYAGDAARMEARMVLKTLVEAEARSGSVIRGLVARRREARRSGRPARRFRSITFRGGLETLPRRMVEVLGPRVRLGAPVSGIGRSDRGCRVELAGADALECDRVVIATDAGAAARLVSGLPGGSAVAADLSAIPRATIAAVGLACEQASVGRPLDGFGFLCGPGSEGPLLGCLFRSTIFPDSAPPGTALLTCFLGGATHDISGISDGGLRDLAVEQVRRLLRITGSIGVPFFRRWPDTIPQFNRGHGERAARITAWSAGGPVSVASSAVHGVSLPVCIATGRAEAERIQPLLARRSQPLETPSCVPA